MSEIETYGVQESGIHEDQPVVMKDYFSKVSEEHAEIKENIRYLQDLFVRRLNEDKQKTEMIRHLQGLSAFAVIEPFISDMLLILDRINGSEDDFARSIGEELYDALNRRGVERIEAAGKFDPAKHKAIRTMDDDTVNELTVRQTIRNGYTFDGRVIRLAEVIVARPINREQV